jgi:hypothetical protein
MTMPEIPTNLGQTPQRIEIMVNRFESLADFEIYILDWLHRARTDDELALFDVSLFFGFITLMKSSTISLRTFNFRKEPCYENFVFQNLVDQKLPCCIEEWLAEQMIPESAESLPCERTLGNNARISRSQMICRLLIQYLFLQGHFRAF